MGEKTDIAWCHHTRNPFIGCSKQHTGCRNCFAMGAQPVVMRAGGRLPWGEVWLGGERVVTADSAADRVLTWARRAARARTRRRVFCGSLCDILEVPEMPPASLDAAKREELVAKVEWARRGLDAAREREWDIIRKVAHWCEACDGRGFLKARGGGHVQCACAGEERARRNPYGLDYLLLTKRPQHWRMVPADVREMVWWGTSISDQATADEWGGRLAQAEGFKLKFFSVEPLVGRITRLPLEGVSWVIVGGESKAGHRPCHVEWVEEVVALCRAAGTACFVKQMGEDVRAETEAGLEGWPMCESGIRVDRGVSPPRLHLVDKVGGDMSEWPERLRIQEFPRAA